MNPPCPSPDFALGVVILAAGASSRMGRAKLLLPWGNTTILGHLLAQWRRLGAHQVSVVCAAHDFPIASELDLLGFPAHKRVTNPHPEHGMMSSIRCAAAWAGWDAKVTHWAIVLGDQPHLRDQTLASVIGFAKAHPESICHPSLRDRARHPVILPRSFFTELARATESDLKEFLLARAESRRLCPVDDPGLDLDIDTPADYERARKLSAGNDCT